MGSVFPDLFLICTLLICRLIFFLNCHLPCDTLKAGLGGILTLDGKKMDNSYGLKKEISRALKHMKRFLTSSLMRE